MIGPAGFMQAPRAEAKAMDDMTLEILRAAINITRYEQVRRLATLRKRLASMYPENAAQVEDAINAWSEYEKGKR